MMATLTHWRDEFLGRGAAAITIPIFDGALKPNRLLEEATVLASVTAPEDLATNGVDLFVADGPRILRLDGSDLREVQLFDRTLTALACLPGGGFAVALAGQEVVTFGGRHGARHWVAVEGKPLVAVNAITTRRDGRLLITDGSTVQPYERWSHDLMARGKSGRLLEINPVDGSGCEIASGLAYAFGTCESAESDGSAWVCESWRHRLMKYSTKGPCEVVLDELPGYPSRIVAASDGGFWLTAFAGRTQLIEFVLREPAYRKRMMAEVDPRYWIAPALHSGSTFLEPLQGAHVKMRGVVKPWAPPRSYGLVMKLSADGSIEYSLHSRLDGNHHGVVSAAECNGTLYVLSKGSRRILQLPIAAIKRQVKT